MDLKLFVLEELEGLNGEWCDLNYLLRKIGPSFTPSLSLSDIGECLDELIDEGKCMRDELHIGLRSKVFIFRLRNTLTSIK